jgi:toxin ParE1/3/4
LQSPITLLAQFPEMGEAVDHFSPQLRRCTLGDYLLFYRPAHDKIELIRVLHGARDIDRLF